MTDSTLLTLALTIVGMLFGLLTALLGWLGNKIYNKLDEIIHAMNEMKDELHNRITETERRSHDKYVELDRRLSTIEGVCKAQHP